jgi:hypothetical protein
MRTLRADNQMPMSGTYAIGAFGDVIAEHTVIRADAILDSLLTEGCWYMMKVTSAVQPGTKFLLYQNRVGFRASVVVNEIVAEVRRTLLRAPLTFAFSHRLTLREINKFAKPLALAPLVHELEFVTNKRYWGTALRTSPRAIPESDYNKIMKRVDGDS